MSGYLDPGEGGYAPEEELPPGYRERGTGYNDAPVPGYQAPEPAYTPYEEPSIPAGDLATYQAAAGQSGYVEYGPADAPEDPFAGYTDEWGGTDPGQAADPFFAYREDHRNDGFRYGETAWYDDPSAAYGLETGSNRLYDEVAEGRFESEIDPFRSYTDQFGNTYHWDPNARSTPTSIVTNNIRAQAPDDYLYDGPTINPFMTGRQEELLDTYLGDFNPTNPNDYAYNPDKVRQAFQEQRNAAYIAAVQPEIDATLWGIQQRQRARQQGYNQVWQGRADQAEADRVAAAPGFQPFIERAALEDRAAYDRSNAWMGEYRQGVDQEHARFGQLVDLIRGGMSPVDVAARLGLSDQERLHLQSAFRAVFGRDPDELARVEQDWLAGHGVGGDNPFQYYQAQAPKGWGGVAMDTLGGVNRAVEGVINAWGWLQGLEEGDVNVLRSLVDVTGLPAATVKYNAVIAKLEGNAASGLSPVGVGPDLLGDIQPDPAFQALVNPADRVRYVRAFLAAHPEIEQRLDLATMPVDFETLGLGAPRLASMLNNVGMPRTRGLGATADFPLQSSPGRARMGGGDVPGSVGPVRGVGAPVAPRPAGGLGAGGDPLLGGGSVGLRPVAPRPARPSRFIANDWDLPQSSVSGFPRPSPEPAARSGAPQAPARRPVPEIPGTVTGRQLAERYAAEGPPVRRRIPDSAFDEGEVFPDLEGELVEPGDGVVRFADPVTRPVRELPRRRPDPTGPGDRYDLAAISEDVRLLQEDLYGNPRYAGLFKGREDGIDRANYVARWAGEYADAVVKGDYDRAGRAFGKVPNEVMVDLQDLLVEGHGVPIPDRNVGLLLRRDPVEVERMREGATPIERRSQSGERRYGEGLRQEAALAARVRDDGPGGRAFAEAWRDIAAVGPLPEPPAVDGPRGVYHRPYEKTRQGAGPTAGRDLRPSNISDTQVRRALRILDGARPSTPRSREAARRIMANFKYMPYEKQARIAISVDRDLPGMSLDDARRALSDVDYGGTALRPVYDTGAVDVPRATVAWEPPKGRAGVAVDDYARWAGAKRPAPEYIDDGSPDFGRGYDRPEDVERKLLAAREDYERTKARLDPYIRRYIDAAEEAGIWSGGSFRTTGRYTSGKIAELEPEIAAAIREKRWDDFYTLISARGELADRRAANAATAKPLIKTVAAKAKKLNALEAKHARLVDPDFALDLPEGDFIDDVPGALADTGFDQEIAGVGRVGGTAFGMPRPPDAPPLASRASGREGSLWNPRDFSEGDILAEVERASGVALPRELPSPSSPAVRNPVVVEPSAVRRAALPGRPATEGAASPFLHAKLEGLRDLSAPAKDFVKRYGNNFAAVAPGVAATQEDDPDRRTLYLIAAAGLGGAGAVALRRQWVRRMARHSGMESYLDPVARRFYKLDTQRYDIATVLSTDLAGRISAGGMAVGKGAHQTVGKLRSYIKTGGYADLIPAMTPQSKLRDQNIRAVMPLVEKRLTAQVAPIVYSSLSPHEVMAKLHVAIDEALQEVIGVSRRTPLDFVGEKVRDFSYNAVLRFNPLFMLKNVRDGHVQKLNMKALGQIGMQRTGKSAELMKIAAAAGNSGWQGPLYLDAQIFQEIALRNAKAKGLKVATSEAQLAAIDRYNPVTRITGSREVARKKDIWRGEADNFLTTAMAEELGLEDGFLKATRKLNVGGERIDFGASGRLKSLPPALKERLLRAKSLEDVHAALKGLPIKPQNRKKIVAIFDSHRRDAQDYALEGTRIRMRDYARRTNLDTVLSAVYPFHYWTTRGVVWNAAMASKYPAAALGVAALAVWHLDENRDLPLLDKIGTEVPVKKLIAQLPDSAFKAHMLEAVDWMQNNHNGGKELHIGPLNWAAETAMNAVKGLEWDSLKNLGDVTDPVNMALAAERLLGWKGRSVAWGVTEDILRAREASMPGWLREWLGAGDEQYGPTGGKGKYYGGVLGPYGDIARGVGERLGMGALPRGFNEAVYGQPDSPGDRKAIYAIQKEDGVDEAEARRRYFARGARKAAFSMSGAKPVQWQYEGPDRGEPPAARPKGGKPAGKTEKQRAADFFKANGEPPEGEGEGAYWTKYNLAVRGDSPSENGRGRTQQQAVRRAGDEAGLKGRQKRFFAAYGEAPEGAGEGAYWTAYNTQVLGDSPSEHGRGRTQQKAVAQQRSDFMRATNDYIHREAERAIEEKRAKNKTEFYARPLAGLGGKTPYQFWLAEQEGYDPYKFVETGQQHQPGSKGPGGGMFAGIAAAAGLAQDNYAKQAGEIWDTYYKMKITHGTKAASAWLNAPYGASGKSRATFAQGYKKEEGLALVGGPSAPASRTPAPSGGGGSSTTPRAASATSPGGNIPARPGSSTRGAAPASSARPAPSGRAATPTRSGSASRAVSPFRRWLERERPDLLAKYDRSAGATERSYEPGVTARETADAWNAWEPLAREGKSSVDEAVPILEAHEKGGGNPAPYVRRAKHAVYERIRAHRGATRQEGDRQRGAWFAAVKALPDTVAGLRKLAALERAVRAAGGKGVAGSGRAA